MTVDNTLEEGLLGHEESCKNKLADDGSRSTRLTKLGLILLNCALNALGSMAPLITRIYYLHGGNRKWLCSWLQTVGFPLLFVPIGILYLRNRKSGVRNVAPPKLMAFSVLVGLVTGVIGISYSYGLLLLPVSTSTLIMSTNLVFTAFFAKFMVGQKFTRLSILAIVLMTLGAAVIGIANESSSNSGVSNGTYMLGFVLTIITAALTGFTLPCSEYAFATTTKSSTYSVVLQFLAGSSFVGTIVSTIGMLISQDFQAIPREASEFGLGMTMYYVLLASSAMAWPMLMLGNFGLVFCTSSLFAGVFGALMVPVTEVVAVIMFNEQFTREKSFSFILCLCGFTSYFYGSYRESRQQKQAPVLS